MLRSMDEPSAAEIASALRGLLPDELLAQFDDDMSAYADLDGDVSLCGVLLAFSGSFRLLIRKRDAASIRDVLAFVDDLLVRHQPEGGVGPRDGSVYNSLLACFLENVLPVRPEEFPVVGPYLGPGVCAHASKFEAWWLEPNADTSPA